LYVTWRNPVSKKTKQNSWALVAQTCNPRYSGGRDQEDDGSKPAWANSSQAPILKKNLSQKRAGGVAQGRGPEFKSPVLQKKEKSTCLRRTPISLPCFHIYLFIYWWDWV
jgi:hypothetical protein